MKWGFVCLLPGLMLTDVVAQAPRADQLVAKPPSQRMLTEEDAKKAAELAKRINDRVAADDYPEAIKSAKELLALRQLRQGSDHYQAIDVSQKLLVLQKVAARDAMQRLSWRQVTGQWQEARKLEQNAKYAEALALQKQILEIRREVLGEEHSETATSYNNLASILNAQGKSAEAQVLYQKTLDTFRKSLGENHPDTATSYNNLASILNAQGKYGEAQPLFLKALNINLNVYGGEHLSTSLSYNNLASNLRSQDKHAEAQPLYSKALDIRLKLLGESHASTATSYNNLASNLDSQGKHAEAVPLHLKALEIYRKVLGESHPDTANSYNNLASSLSAQGKIIEAQPLYLKAFSIRFKVLGREHVDTASSFNNVADNFRRQSKYAEAQNLYRAALEIYRKVLGEEHPLTAMSYDNLAFVLNAQGKPAEAQPYYLKALEIRRKLFGDEHSDTALSYNNIASCLNDQRKYAQAQIFYQKSLDIDLKVLGEGHPETANCYNNLALNLLAQAKYLEATNVLRQAIFSVEASRLIRARGIERAIGSSFDARLLLATIEQATDPVAAWMRTEATLARGLLDQLGQITLTPAERSEQSQLQAFLLDRQTQILALVSQEDRSQAEQAQLEGLLRERKEAVKKLAALAVAESARSVASREAIQGAIPADAALLLWLDANSRTGDVEEHFACVVRREGDPKWVRLVGTGENGKWTEADTLLIPQLSSALASSAPSHEVESLAKRLRTQRIEPVLKHLDGVKALYVVGANWMAGVPVSVLTNDFTICSVPSGTFLARLKTQPRPTHSAILAFGDAIYEVEKKPGKAIAAGEWSDLPGTRFEANRLQQLFGDSAKIYTDSSASEQTLERLRKQGELSKFRYLHFATHGDGNNSRAFESTLIFSQDNLPTQRIPKSGEPLLDGQLSAREVLNFWKLNAELVTLSACETAVGKEGAGDGLLGFAQAFLHAGSRSVCLSLWKVDDTATALLMGRFYENLLGKRDGLSKPMPKALALDEAKRWLRNLSEEEAKKREQTLQAGVVRPARGDRKVVVVGLPPLAEMPGDRPFAHPRFWAAFILMGDPD